MGCVVLGLSIYALIDGDNLESLVSSGSEVIGSDFTITVYSSAAIILIVVSALVVIVSFFGCCGAIKESKCMLGTYFTIVLALFIAMTVGAVYGYTQDLVKHYIYC